MPLLDFLRRFADLYLLDWPVSVPTILGLAALYLLLPRPRPYPRLVGAAVAIAALVAGAYFLARSAPVTVEAILFYAFAGLAVVSGVVMITRSNPARAALSFAVVILSTTGLFLLQAAPFLMAGTIIIYAGAIIVTFLFVIMLAQPYGVSDADLRSREPALACVAGFFLLATLLLALRQTYGTGDFNSVLARIDAARQQDSAAGMRQALGELPVLERDINDDLATRLPGRPAATRSLQEATDALSEVYNGDDTARLRDRLDRLHAAVSDAGQQVGRLQPSERTPLSPFAGTPANRPAQGLPAENVAGLGRALFTDYLLAVEIAGTLLLVATVGAIALAHRPAPRRTA